MSLFIFSCNCTFHFLSFNDNLKLQAKFNWMNIQFLLIYIPNRETKPAKGTDRKEQFKISRKERIQADHFCITFQEFGCCQKIPDWIHGPRSSSLALRLIMKVSLDTQTMFKIPYLHLKIWQAYATCPIFLNESVMGITKVNKFENTLFVAKKASNNRFY
jgi:hypothetical protein